MRLTENSFDIIIFLGRPGSGKSEVIDFLDKQDVEKRIENYSVSDYETLDDFVDLWIKGEEDDILEELGKQRLYTKKDPTGYSVSNPFLYKFLIKKINKNYEKKYQSNTDFFKNKTLFIEFSRGGEKGYETAFKLLSEDILKKAVVVYVKVSYEESCRKNQKRYNPDAKDSILQHALPEYIMKLYETDDWDKLTSDNQDYFEINNIKVPYYTFQNEPELTNNFDKLAPAVKKCFDELKDKAIKY
jgi:hypothetical protein